MSEIGDQLVILLLFIYLFLMNVWLFIIFMQAESTITVGNYSFDSRYCIGQGSFGKVYKGNPSPKTKAKTPKQTN